MPISTRLYLLEADGALKRIPMRVVNGLVFGADAVPAYVKSTKRIIPANLTKRRVDQT